MRAALFFVRNFKEIVVSVAAALVIAHCVVPFLPEHATMMIAGLILGMGLSDAGRILKLSIRDRRDVRADEDVVHSQSMGYWHW